MCLWEIYAFPRLICQFCCRKYVDQSWEYINRLLCVTLQRTNTENSKQIIPEKELRGHGSNFHIHVSVSDLYIPTIDLPILLQEICGCGPILGIYKSPLVRHTAKNQYRKFETNNPRKGIERPRFQFPHSCGCERFIYSHNRSAYSAAGNMWTDPGNI